MSNGQNVSQLGGEIPEGNPQLVLLAGRQGPQLDSVEKVRLELGKLYRRMLRGKVRPDVGSRLAYVLLAILKALELEVVEHRVKDIQHLLQEDR